MIEFILGIIAFLLFLIYESVRKIHKMVWDWWYTNDFGVQAHQKEKNKNF